MRIASLAPSVTTMLQELGVSHAIVACTHLCPLPATQRAQLAVGSFSVLDVAKLAAAKPDLVITATLVQARGHVRFKEAGYATLHLNPQRLVDIGENYVALGSRVGRAERGRELKTKFLQDVAALHQERASQANRTVRVYMEEWHEPPYVSGNWVPDVVALAGGVSVLAVAGEPSRPITLAELAQADPDLIVQHVCLPPTRDWTEHRQLLLARVAARPGWAALRAIRRGQLYAVSDTPFNMPTRGVLAGVKKLIPLMAHVPTSHYAVT